MMMLHIIVVITDTNPLFSCMLLIPQPVVWTGIETHTFSYLSHTSLSSLFRMMFCNFILVFG